MDRMKRYTISVLIGGVHTYHPRRIMAGIQDAAKEFDVDVYFFLGTNTKKFFEHMIGEDLDDAHEYQLNTTYDYSVLSGMDGVIINYGSIGIYMEDANCDNFISKFNSVPTVVLTECTDASNCHYLISDNEQGMRTVLEHLIQDHGYRKILYISGPKNNTDAEERKSAYMNIMKESGIPCDESMIRYGDYYEFVDRQVEELLDAYPDAEALVFANDEMAVAGYRVCAKRGLVVGKDIAITGYDDCKLAENLNPPLSTIRQDGYFMGWQAVSDLVERLKGHEVHSRRIPGEFEKRESCGCSMEGRLQPQTGNALEKECRRLTGYLAQQQQDMMEFERKTWFFSFLSRDLSNYTGNEKDFCRQIMVDLKKVSMGNTFLFLLDTPVQYESGGLWIPPQKVYLAASLKDGHVAAYDRSVRPKINKEHTLKEILCDETSHRYSFLLLCSGDRQYGLLAYESHQEELPFFHMLGLQLGLLLRYREMSEYEAAHVRELSRDMEQMQWKNQELERHAEYDMLTGLLNLRGFEQQIKKMRPTEKSISLQCCMIYGDLDHLKEINDTWGHREGDYALRAVGHILQQCLRGDDIVGRIGGDEFIALVNATVSNFEEVFRERVRQLCQELNEQSGKPYYVELSLGVVPFEFTADTDIQSVISKADKLLYEHKKNRRESICKLYA